MSELMLVISKIKARAISAFHLCPELVEQVVYIPDDDDHNNNFTDVGSKIDPEIARELETYFHDHLSNGH